MKKFQAESFSLSGMTVFTTQDSNEAKTSLKIGYIFLWSTPPNPLFPS
jgi:hypothetical protein